MITVLTPARNTAFVTLARLKSELGLTDDDPTRDTRLQELIDEASALVMDFLQYSVLRERVQERLTGSERTELMLSRTPVVALEEVTNEETGATDSLSDGTVRVADSRAGTVWRQDGWGDDRPYDVGLTVYPQRVPQLGEQPWLLTYVGGSLLPSDDTTLSGWSIVDGRLEAPADVETPMLASGEIIRIAGWTGANGRYRVTARDVDFIELSQPPDDDTAPNDAMLYVSSLDSRLSRAVIETIKMFFAATGRDPSVTSEKIGDWAATYGGQTRTSSGLTVLPESVQNTLASMRRES